MCRTHYTYESGREDITTLYLVPVAPGVTRAYNKVVLKNVASRTKSIFNFLSKTVLSSGFFHAFGHGLVDQVRIGRVHLGSGHMGVQWTPSCTRAMTMLNLAAGNNVKERSRPAAVR